MNPGRFGSAWAIGLALAASLSACSVDRALRADTYTVARGDTLSEISQRFDVDWRELARWNRIDSPYRLSVGQTLYLKPFPPIDYARFESGDASTHAERSEPSAGRRTSRAMATSTSTTRPASQPAPREQPAHRETAVSSTPSVQAEPADVPRQPTASDAGAGVSTPEPESVEQSRDEQAARSSEIAEATNQSESDQSTIKAGGPSEDGWQWPATGTLYRSYGDEERGRGIEITGSLGNAIYAASSGTVVYNGTGLKGYGQLIIIKHDAHYLSAYGFVRDSRVSQGETVAAGQQIAEMGLGPGNKPLLHFEIRRDGKPIDPEERLPER